MDTPIVAGKPPSGAVRGHVRCVPSIVRMYTSSTRSFESIRNVPVRNGSRSPSGVLFSVPSGKSISAPPRCRKDSISCVTAACRSSTLKLPSSYLLKYTGKKPQRRRHAPKIGQCSILAMNRIRTRLQYAAGVTSGSARGSMKVLWLIRMTLGRSCGIDSYSFCDAGSILNWMCPQRRTHRMSPQLKPQLHIPQRLSSDHPSALPTTW
mmetsp:Transcript_39909/g.123322  ORF Transcript_39909/g.123322 Transcript_39909/m.123322 type:complete len:208 (-) Transcript_39909:290-913(-)